MSMHEPTTRRPSKQRWVIPAVALTIGIGYLVAGLIGGDHFFAVFGLAVMLVTAAAFVLLSRFSETIAGLMDRRDERINRIDQEATMISGLVVIVAIIVGFTVEVARGRDGWPYSMLGAVAGLSYLLALVVLRFRR